MSLLDITFTNRTCACVTGTYRAREADKCACVTGTPWDKENNTTPTVAEKYKKANAAENKTCSATRIPREHVSALTVHRPQELLTVAL